MLVLLGFGRSLATECVSMINQPCMVRLSLVYLNPNEIHYYPFVISLETCDRSRNTDQNVFSRICKFAQ